MEIPSWLVPGSKIVCPIEPQGEESVINPGKRISNEQYESFPSSSRRQDDKTFASEITYRYRQVQQLPEIMQIDANARLHERIVVSKNELEAFIMEPKKERKGKDLEGPQVFFEEVFQNLEIKGRYIKVAKDALRRQTEALSKISDDSNIGEAVVLESALDVLGTFSQVKDFIPDNLYLDMLLEYEKRFVEKTKGIRETLMDFYDNALTESILKFAEEFGINQEMLQKRLESLKGKLNISFSDTSMFVETNIAGSTDCQGELSLNPFLDIKRQLKYTFSHEVIHNLGGKSYRIFKDSPIQGDVPDEGYSDEDIPTEELLYAVPEKSGLKVFNRLRWLNEATTELITEYIGALIAMRGSYKDEIGLLEKLLWDGKNEISLDLLFQAFFEGHDKNLSEQEQFPYLKKLFVETSKSFSRGFLMKLDFASVLGIFIRSDLHKVVNNFSKIASVIEGSKGGTDTVDKVTKFLSGLPKEDDFEDILKKAFGRS